LKPAGASRDHRPEEAAMTTPRIGLALGAGGARGLAHIPVVEALDEMGLRPAEIAGSSVGAVIGAGVAAGMSGRDIRRYVLDVFGTRSELLARFWQLRPQSLAELMQQTSRTWPFR
jgi:NTE family protein